MSLQCMANVLCKGCGQKGHVRKDCTGESSSQHHSDKGIMSSTNKEMCDSSLNLESGTSSSSSSISSSSPNSRRHRSRIVN